MKIYCFYLVLNEINVSEYPAVKADAIKNIDNKDYSFYAFTPDKNIADTFRKIRNMNKFYERVITIDRDEYEDFCDENNDQLLEYHLFATKVIKYGNYHKDTVYLNCTKSESDIIIYYKNDFFYSIINDNLIRTKMGILPDIQFNNGLHSILSEYFYFDKIMNSNRLSNIDDSDIVIDQVALFIRLFYNTLTDKVKEDIK